MTLLLYSGVLLKYKKGTEKASVVRHQKGDGKCRLLLVSASCFMSVRKPLIRYERHLKADGVSPGPSPTICIFEIGLHEVCHPQP